MWNMRTVEERLDRVEAALERLAAAQARTEERMAELAAAQARTEDRLGRLEGAVERSTEGIDRLRKQVGGLSHTVRGDIEDIAYIVLHDVLKREFGWDVGVLGRTGRPGTGRSKR
jgi:chromosome segregation ATPase